MRKLSSFPLSLLNFWIIQTVTAHWFCSLKANWCLIQSWNDFTETALYSPVPSLRWSWNQDSSVYGTQVTKMWPPKPFLIETEVPSIRNILCLDQIWTNIELTDQSNAVDWNSFVLSLGPGPYTIVGQVPNLPTKTCPTTLSPATPFSLRLNTCPDPKSGRQIWVVLPVSCESTQQ